MKLKLLALLIVGLLPQLAFADIYVGSFRDRNGDIVDAYEDEEGDNYFIVWIKTGGYYIIGGGRPGPDESGKLPPSSAAEVQNLLKKVKNAYEPKKNAEQTVIGKYLNARGRGFAPRGNPGDTGYGDKGVPTSPGAAKGPSQEELARQRAARNVTNYNVRTQGNMNNDMSGGIGGGGEGPGFKTGGPKQGGSGKNGSTSLTNYDDRKNKNLGKTEDIGPRPEVVNPPPIKRTR